MRYARAFYFNWVPLEDTGMPTHQKKKSNTLLAPASNPLGDDIFSLILYEITMTHYHLVGLFKLSECHFDTEHFVSKTSIIVL